MTIPRAAERLSPEVIADPQAFWDRLRHEGPVHELPGLGIVVVTRHEDVRQVARRPDLFSSKLVAVLMASQSEVPQVLDVRAEGPAQADALAIADPPEHTRHRQLLNPPFNVRRIAALEPAIRALATGLADGFAPDGAVEWMEGFAVPLPITIIGDLLALPRDRLADVRRWSDASVRLLSGTNTPADLLACHGSIMEFQTFLAAHLDSHRAAPGDDVMGDLARAVDADPPILSTAEALNILITLVTAGNESTTSGIGSAARLLLAHPEIQMHLSRERAAIPAFVDEVLRLESPFHGHFRVALADTEIGGVAIAAGTRLMLLWGSANRDAGVFSCPGDLDLSRPNVKEHIAFGHGIHFCLGAPLARLEMRIAMETLLDRLPGARLSPTNTYRYTPSLLVRRLEALDLTWPAGC
jgi:cytochrome P450 family 144